MRGTPDKVIDLIVELRRCKLVGLPPRPPRSVRHKFRNSSRNGSWVPHHPILGVRGRSYVIIVGVISSIEILCVTR